jgi:cleavage and polyadenylation specificity factor subunit 4
MEDSEGVLSFDFEGGLDAGPAANAAATSGPHIIHADSAVGAATNANVAAAGAGATAEGGVGGNAGLGRRSFRQTVCRHWLRSLCMKGDACGFLHQYDKSRMPVCRFFRLYGECREQDCVYKHTNEDIKECNMYVLLLFLFIHAALLCLVGDAFFDIVGFGVDRTFVVMLCEIN